MDYGKAFGYYLNREGGTKSLLLASLTLASSAVIPIVGQMVFMGYQAEVCEDLERDPAIEDHDDFKFEHFSRYLARGVWPFLMAFLVHAVAVGCFVASLAAGFALGYALQIPWLGFVSYFVLIVPISLLVSMASLPLMLHVQLTGKLRVGAAFAFATRFLGKLWGQCFVTLAIQMIISLPIIFGGMLLCCVGFYPAMAFVMLAQEHLTIQLYRIYLAEGGEPIGSAAEDAEYDDH